jgi:alkaline phosphatase
MPTFLNNIKLLNLQTFSRHHKTIKDNQKVKCSANKNYTLASERKTLLQTTKKKAEVFSLFFEGATHLRSN